MAGRRASRATRSRFSAGDGMPFRTCLRWIVEHLDIFEHVLLSFITSSVGLSAYTLAFEQIERAAPLSAGEDLPKVTALQDQDSSKPVSNMCCAKAMPSESAAWRALSSDHP